MCAKNCTQKPKTWLTSYTVSTRSSCRETQSLVYLAIHNVAPILCMQQQHRGLQTITPPYTELKNLLDNLHKPVWHEQLIGCCSPCFVYLVVYIRCTNPVHTEQQVLHQPCACSNNTDACRQLYLHTLNSSSCRIASTCVPSSLG